MTDERNQEEIVTIESLSNEALGVARVNNKVWFVQNALPGERVLAHVIKPNKNYCIAKAIDVIEPSQPRRVPPCSVYGRCGGCACQHMSYEATLEFKREHVKNALERIGKVQGANVLPITPSENRFAYRNKGAFPVGQAADSGVSIGCFAAHSHNIIEPPNGCIIHPDTVNNALSRVKEWMAAYHILPYNEQAGTGFVRHVVTRVNRAGDMLLTIVVNSKDASLPRSAELFELVRRGVPKLSGLSVSPNPERGNAIFGGTCVTICGEPAIRETLNTLAGSIEIEISPRSFFQVNTGQAERLIDAALTLANPQVGEHICDVYAGAGTFTLPFAKTGASVSSVEIVADAVEDAKRNARWNGLNIDIRLGDASRVLPELVKKNKLDCILLDPPRKGCDADVLAAAAKASPSRIIYVSCDPATLARDAAILAEQGYTLDCARPVDMFPWTSSVETCAKFIPARFLYSV
ncbi:MAG: 23S rRNA (uracil(1939)-C(5))-methyltransferase RlmD [Oscillospiraceae bacterium]|jgi:23S rRNA (uracil1939-C5)-methyltransferase|nr:23S rRNA (uracil(1939)-C(5))-methyltransferase RlmD [Oscillospiraceae bacterium]